MKGYVYQSDGFPHIDADPNAIRNYAWYWTDWLLQEGATTIQSATITVDAGLTKVGSAVVSGGGIVSQVISGGVAGTSYKAVCRITTTSGLQDERTIIIDVKEQ